MAKSARVSHKHAALKLSCAGSAGSRCAGTVTLTTTIKVKVKIKIKVKSKGGHQSKKGKSKPKTKTKTKTKIKKKTILVGSVDFGLKTGASDTFIVKLTKGAGKALAKTRRGRLRAKALIAGSFPRTVTLVGHKHKHKKHRRHGGHKHH